MSLSFNFQKLYQNTAQVLILIELIFSLMVVAAVPILASQWTGSSFLDGQTLTPANRLLFILLPYIVGLLYLVLGTWTFVLRRKDAVGRAFAFFAISVAIAAMAIFDTLTTHRLTLIWLVALIICGGACTHITLSLPLGNRWIEKKPLLRMAGYLPAAILIIITLFTLQSIDSAILLRIILAYLACCVLIMMGWLFFRVRISQSPIEKEQARTLLWGALISFGPITLWMLFRAIQGQSTYNPVLLLPMIIFPITAAYTVQRYRLLSTNYVFSRTLLYGMMTLLSAVAFALLAAGFTLVTASALSITNPIIIGSLLFILALAISPVQTWLKKGVDAAFSRSGRAQQEKLQAFSHQMTMQFELDGILNVLRQMIGETFSPTILHIFIYDPASEQYIAAFNSGKTTSDLRFPNDHALVKFLSRQHTPLFIGDQSSLPVPLQKEQVRLALLNAQVYIPLSGRQRLSGWLALGARRSAEAYTSGDLNFLEAISDQAALAIERAQVVINMENRVRETNALARIAQGVNVTLSFDDILELVYAQTVQIIPSSDFRLTLYDPKTDIFQQAFYLEMDERLSEQENKPIPPGQTLEQEVVRTRRPLITEDVTHECQQRGIVSPYEGQYAWMSVPLNAGAETIGAISLGSRNPGIAYTSDQMNLLQAIADQTAGAIVKTRLLQESQRRAHQLATINNVLRQLTSTLDLSPLLEKILQSAVEILNCEAGSLMLIDNQTNELVFEVTVGPVAANLLHKRMPASGGLAGKSVTTHQPIIVNDVQQANGWSNATDQTTGFTTHAMLVTPLEVKENVIGVIEVINKKDGNPFITDDQDLLGAFAGQAAVAIENARLYTLTDRALEARVEELSVMQRIDRELNTSLDITRAMRITLDWAMRQSAANAGFVGVLEEGGIHIMASQGYSEELIAYQDTLMPVDLLKLSTVVETEQAVQIHAPEKTLLADTQNQIVLPIRRESAVIGLLFMESIQVDPASEETLSFLTRLTDHAAIAIANAQLYNAVQAANIAKSEFVSFVSHELKNPMTSIKGYTELLAAGAVGPINEAQANFLGTIRSNTERMSTLVSDLADVSRIEAGRLRLDFKQITLSEVTEEVIRSTRRQIEEKQQVLTVDLPVELPAVWADRTRLAQVLTNLVSNAYKYTQAGGNITVKAEACVNTWDTDGAPQVVHIWVQDNGIGISEEDQNKIFQKFFRSEDPKTREAPGTGLGLNITRSLVEHQGGRIWFESKYRQGTTFHFTIPVAQ